MIDALAWAATALLLLAYARGGRRFDWANATMWPFIAASAFVHHALPSAVVTLAFGAIGTAHLLRRR